MMDLTRLSRRRLEDMAEAGRQVQECTRVLAKTGDNVVGEILRDQGEFYEWDHYPRGDVYDWNSHSQYYYHAHPVEMRGGEHGHFHTFMRPKGMPAGIKPAALPDYRPPKNSNDALSHLAAFSMDHVASPIRIFTTNRWVTGEVWYESADVIRLLDRFVMDLAHPSWPVNLWVSAMVRLFRPQIEDLLRQRDRTIADWAKAHPETNVYEDRDLEVTSACDISIEDQVDAVNHALKLAAA